jgi:uncharacterized phiE125 gp8 family phage protein
MAGSTLVTAPSAEPMSTADAKAFLRVDSSDDDTLISQLVFAARRACESYTGRALVTQTWKLFLDGFSEVDIPLWEGMKVGADIAIRKRFIPLPKPPLASVTHIKTYDDDDTATTFASSKYFVDTASESGRIVLREGETFPTALRVANAVEIQYVAGYGAASAVPEALIVGMKEHITYLYENRGDAMNNALTMPVIAKQLYQPYRILSFTNNPYSNGG